LSVRLRARARWGEEPAALCIPSTSHRLDSRQLTRPYPMVHGAFASGDIGTS
jgi:hypothetical protein